MSINLQAPVPESVAVSTAVLTVLGASSWTGADPNVSEDRTYSLTNCGTTDVYVLSVLADAADTVSSSTYEKVVGEGETKSILLKAGQELQIVRASGTGNVVARRFQ